MPNTLSIKSSWTDERVTDLCRLAADGLSAGRIAVELGGVTRNAVIGKCLRMGFPLLGTAGKPGPGTRRFEAQRAKRTKPPKPLHHPPAISPTRLQAFRAEHDKAAEATELPADRSTTGVSIFELTSETCRWPYGDPGTIGFHFCGAPPIKPLPYCSGHCLLAYALPNAERRRASPQPRLLQAAE